MEYENFGALDSSIQERINNDTEFLSSIESLSDEEKQQAIDTKRTELLDEEIKNLTTTAKKAKEVAENQKIRAEKAERERSTKATIKETPKNNEELSTKDAIVLAKSNVHEDDIDEVVRYAKYQGVSISEALKDDVLLTIINNRSEKRQSALASNIGKGVRATSTKINGRDLVNNLSKGEVPEPGTVEAEELFWAKRGGRK